MLENDFCGRWARELPSQVCCHVRFHHLSQQRSAFDFSFYPSQRKGYTTDASSSFSLISVLFHERSACPCYGRYGLAVSETWPRSQAKATRNAESFAKKTQPTDLLDRHDAARRALPRLGPAAAAGHKQKVPPRPHEGAAVSPPREMPRARGQCSLSLKR